MTENAPQETEPETLPPADARRMADVCAFLAGVLASPPGPGTADAVSRMASAAGIGCPADAPAAAIERDYLDLFIVPNPRYVAPYESVYRDRWEVPSGLQPTSMAAAGCDSAKGMLMGESTLQVRRIQLEAGIEPLRDLPDHVANELWLLAHFWRKEAEAPPGERLEWARRREHFSREHLQAWIGKLADKVRQNQRLGVYGAALEIAEAVTGVD